MNKKKKKEKARKPKAKAKPLAIKVLKLAPERPEARDEGPRLIPLDEKRSTDQFGRRSLELADIALGLRAPQPKRHHPKKKS